MTPARRGAVALAVALALAVGCGEDREQAESETPYRPHRRDYATFRTAYPEVPEPNYLPFMVHRFPGDDPEGDLLVFCRWSPEAMPLAVHIATPSVPAELQNEFFPKQPVEYVEAVARALATWEAEMQGLVRFRRVERRKDANLQLILLGEQAPEPDPEHRVLGRTRLAESCRRRGWDPDADRLEVRFRVSELQIYVADGFGPLDPDQVEWIALHEIGHALGMRGHSPIPADLMYEVARERVHVRGLSAEDVNSFVALYRLPNGTVFGRVPPGAPDPPPRPQPPSGPPRLAPEPYVDPRFGFELRPPHGWLAIETAKGMVAVDGVTWDYTASFQVVVERYATIEEYLGRYASHYRSRGRIRSGASLVVNGRRAYQAAIERFGGHSVEVITLIESGDGRVLVVTADCPAGALGVYRPWFEAAMASLVIEGSEGRPGVLGRSGRGR